MGISAVGIFHGFKGGDDDAAIILAAFSSSKLS